MGATHTQTKADALRQAKVCSGCRGLKPFSAFRHLRTGANGLHSRCKSCADADCIARRRADPEKTLEGSRRRAMRHYYKDVEKSRERNRVSRRKHMTPARRREAMLEDKYGITQATWDAMFTQQGHLCAICASSDPQSSRGWHTDHDHKAGHVRGILCGPCNYLLGWARDSQQTLLTAVSYLSNQEKHNVCAHSD